MLTSPHLFCYAFNQQEGRLVHKTINTPSQQAERASHRLTELSDWVTRHAHETPISITPLLKEASVRQYYRITWADRTLVAVDTPPNDYDNRPFIEVANAFHQQGLSVPRLHGHNLQRGFLLMDDFGDRLLLNELNETTADKLYTQALSQLVNIHSCEHLTTSTTPVMDHDALSTELDWYIEWYIIQGKQLTLTHKQHDTWLHVKDSLIQNALSQPQVLLHKDFHSRNLMRLDDDNIGILDFQDALFGPITYDIASLLNDCYIDWPREKVEHWCHEFMQSLQSHELLPTTPTKQFMTWFDLTSLQRHLKNLGNFIRAYRVRQQSQYLQYLPRMHNTILSICQRYPSLESFYQDFNWIHQQPIQEKNP